MRALVGGLLGLAAGAAVVAALDVAQGGKAYWSVLIAGLVAGVLMRNLAGGGGSPYAKGALAALATALAAVGGPMAATQWISAQNAASTPDKAVASSSADDSAEDETDAEPAEAPAPPVITPTESTAPLSNVRMRRPKGDQSDVRDLVCLAVGCLLAYQMGKGPAAKTEEAGEEADSEAPTDPGDNAGSADAEEGDGGEE